MKLEVSIGEAIDKLSILEIKLLKISDEKKKTEIKKEIEALSQCLQYKSKYEFYYNLLVYVNEKIWTSTDIIKSITIDNPQFATISNDIFNLNQKRFRLKNLFNILINSNIKEQKSYASTHCKIYVENQDIFFNKLPEINYLALEYDILTFDSPDINVIQEFLKIPTIIYDREGEKLLNQPININLEHFSIPSNELIDNFSLKPITYIVGGMFGDFIQVLSVICEKFYETGKKGILYISNRGDIFRNGLENTFNDTYNVILKQNYIHSYKIYNNESYDIDLTSWRNSPKLYKENWYHIFKEVYNIDWGKHIWLKVPNNDIWKDKIIVNTTNYRFPNTVNFKSLKEIYRDDLIFISTDKNQHNFFENNAGIRIHYYEFKSFLDLVTIISSCKLFIGSLSAPLSIAHSLHKDRIIGFKSDNNDCFMNLKLDEFLPNIRYNI